MGIGQGDAYLARIASATLNPARLHVRQGEAGSNAGGNIFSGRKTAGGGNGQGRCFVDGDHAGTQGGACRPLVRRTKAAADITARREQDSRIRHAYRQSSRRAVEICHVGQEA